MHDYPITRYIGCGIIILAILEVFNVTDFKPLLLLGFSFAALLLTFIDFLEFKTENKKDPFKYRKLKLIVLFLAICFFIIVPNLSISLTDIIIEKLNNVAVLLSIGLLFVILGYKQEKIVNDSFLNIVNKMIEETVADEVDKMVEQTVSEMFEENKLTETIKEAMDKIEKEAFNR